MSEGRLKANEPNVLNIAVPKAAILIILTLPYRSESGPNINVNNPKESMYAVTDIAAVLIVKFKSLEILIISGAAA
jgi:hypothetical protein